MLKEIRCDLFKESGKLRPSIIFNKGLNIILGSVPGKAGSIGKSTMLLIIDFVFGGNTYKKVMLYLNLVTTQYILNLPLKTLTITLLEIHLITLWLDVMRNIICLILLS